MDDSTTTDRVRERTASRRQQARRRPRSRVKFTRRFYAVLGILAGLVLLIILIAAISSGGGGEEGLQALVMSGGANQGDLYRLKVNELGAIMVLEYHVIGKEDRWSRTPENFRADLDLLYEQGYRCVSLKDLATNNIAVEAGYTPVAFTFDDSSPSQFRYIEQDGETVIDPTCAMGVMEQFAAEHPDFHMTATFYVLPDLFGQPEYAEKKLRYLVEHGYDIGNHSVNHIPFERLGDADITEEITGNISVVRKYLPDYLQASIALPNGSEPANAAVLASGSMDGVEYSFVASLLVGANPAPAPTDRSFDPMRLPRVQALDPSLDTGNCGICAWLQYFMENPERRYRSDGNPAVVTVPKHMEGRVDRDKLGERELVTY